MLKLINEKTTSPRRCEIRESRPSQWEKLLRNFTQTHKEECKKAPGNLPRFSRPLKVFPTGSTYFGTWDALGMSGEGTYTFPNGVIYEGQFKDGMFDGEGEMRYPCGSVIKGKWREGTIYERTLIFPDTLHYSEQDWRYCKMPDRRFAIEYQKGLKPATETYKTAKQPTRAIPAGYYDTGDGFYDPKTKAVYHDDLISIIRSPNIIEQLWIIEHCRTAPDANIGPCRNLYEEWNIPNVQKIKIPDPAVPCHKDSAIPHHPETFERPIVSFPPQTED